ncbi:hypothetical protein AL755_10880 [Arthrobacter sp. ERGS1:01]|uniref:HNH endonuclease signature motif containing protein n=1 Tax=Arthrobacter sp. ERGS1:01 TaxID=1704044 RepID=UPI0006B45EF0|nr:HNH endonuclease signature motif containing protein [Arthrobacter sp. ERGS1:01]ALE05858.1 hypothetical protein AL755_10880 [Arthrobacter sp. ERGS1:01]
MGALDRPEATRDSTLFGPPLVEDAPGHSRDRDPGSTLTELSDADLARLIALDPGDADLAGATAVSSRELTAAEWAYLTASADTTACVEAVPAGIFDTGASVPSAVALRTSRIQTLRASVPALPEAPRDNNPIGVQWSPSAGVDALAGLDPAGLCDNDLLDYLHAANRLAAFARAVEGVALTEFAERHPPLASEGATDSEYLSKWAAAEIMAVYAMGEGASLHRMTEAGILVNDLPESCALYRDGLLDTMRIEAILRGVIGFPAELSHTLEPMFLPGASRMNPAALTRRIRKLAQAHHPDSHSARHERARRERRVWFTPLDDGMAQLGAILPAVQAKALFETLGLWARNARREGLPSQGNTPTGRPSRSLNNYMADALLDLLQLALQNPTGQDACGNPNCGAEHRPAAKSWVVATINVEVPAFTLLGRSEEPGMLEGYGPIPPDQARELAAGSPGWIRILTHPEKRTRLSVGRSRYRPPPDMARLVRLREPACTGIGCDVPASRCELDHIVPFHLTSYSPDGWPLPRGETSVANLLPRSLYCHQLKDDPSTGWRVEPEGPGVTRTTTPTGRVYRHVRDDDAAPF